MGSLNLQFFCMYDLVSTYALPTRRSQQVERVFRSNLNDRYVLSLVDLSSVRLLSADRHCRSESVCACITNKEHYNLLVTLTLSIHCVFNGTQSALKISLAIDM